MNFRLERAERLPLKLGLRRPVTLSSTAIDIDPIGSLGFLDDPVSLLNQRAGERGNLRKVLRHQDDPHTLAVLIHPVPVLSQQRLVFMRNIGRLQPGRPAPPKFVQDQYGTRRRQIGQIRARMPIIRQLGNVAAKVLE
ncbi:hypothetical protein D9M71_634640 [compost metagenome]